MVYDGIVMGDDMVLTCSAEDAAVAQQCVAELGSRQDWMANVLGQEIFGCKLISHAETVQGVVKPVVRLPLISGSFGAESLARLFGAASGAALRNAYTTFEFVESVASSTDSSSVDTEVGIAPSAAADRAQAVPALEVSGDIFAAPEPVGKLLADMNDMVLARTGVMYGSQVASGYCYEVMFVDKHRQQAKIHLGRWPMLRDLLGVPSAWFADAETLQRIGVSVRGGNLHFQLGWGEGVLTAIDIIAVGTRGRSGVGGRSGLHELLGMKVGGPSCNPDDCRQDEHCREAVLRKLSAKKLAVWGNDLSGLQASPGWAEFVRRNENDDETSIRRICPDGVICSCWKTIPHWAECEACEACGFMVKPHDHKLRCKMPAIGLVDSDVKSLAWLGDALHQFDVRLALLGLHDYGDAVKLLEKYVSSSAQYRYLLMIGENVTDIRSASDRFESGYEDIREDYRKWLINDIADVDSDPGIGDTMALVVQGTVGLGIAADESKASFLSRLVSANDKEGFKRFVRDSCGVKDFQLLEYCMANSNNQLNYQFIDEFCKPSVAGSLNVEEFERLVAKWFSEHGTLSDAIGKVVRGRAIANVGKRVVMRILRELA